MCLGRSLSSRNVPAQDHAAEDAVCEKESTEFVNQGLILWNQNRQKWVGDKRVKGRSLWLRAIKLRSHRSMDRKLRHCCINSSKGKHKLLNSSKPFPRPIPVGEMVDFLVVTWEDEGLYEMV